MAKSLPSPLTIPQPLRGERWRHSFADAKRRSFGSKFYKFTIKFNEVSQAEFSNLVLNLACDTKFKTNYREMILNVLK